MSIRRKIGDVVQIDEDEDGKYLARIVETTDRRGPDECVYGCGDWDCKEWPALELLDAAGNPTGRQISHVAECAMTTPVPGQVLN